MQPDHATWAPSPLPTGPAARPIPPSRGIGCLFLDVDGTLLDIAPTPADVHVDDALVSLLARLSERMGGAVALVSGRTAAELDYLFHPLRLAVAGIHGNERRRADGLVARTALPSQRLAPARTILRSLIKSRPGLLLEDKGAALALHFRLAPQARDIASLAMRQLAADLHPEFELLSGDAVLEIKPAACSKASAVEAFMAEPPFAGRRPAYLGDDMTDCDGFAATRRFEGFDIAVGTRVSARWTLDGPQAVRAWLAGLLSDSRDAR